MELGGYIIVSCAVVYLLFRVFNLQGIVKELRMELMEHNVFAIEPLLETKTEFIIDGDAEALPVAGCMIAYHQKNGQLKWTGAGKFYINKESIRGHELHEKLLPEYFDYEVLNRNYLDFLVKNQDIIPKNWPLLIPFFGTVYRQLSDGRCFVKCLSRRDGIYMVENRYLDTDFASIPAILK